MLGSPTTAVADAHTAGLLVHSYTFRAENNFLSSAYRIGADLTAYGNYQDETLLYLQLGIDGFFTDQPDFGARAVAAVPEPASVAVVGAVAVAALRRRRI